MRAEYLKSCGVAAFLIIMASSAPGAKSQVSEDPSGYTNRGVRYAREKQYDKAIDEFTKAIEAQPKDPNNYRNRAQVYELIKQPEKAIADYGKIIERAPKDADAYAGRGRLEAQTKKYDAAIKDLSRVKSEGHGIVALPRLRFSQQTAMATSRSRLRCNNQDGSRG